MARGGGEELPSEIGALADRLDAYRSSRRRQRRLPEDLWTQAAQLARRYGVCRVQRALRLHYYDLQQRAEALPEPIRGTRHSAPKAPRPAFVELGLHPSLARAGTILEVEDRTGRKLTVRLAAEHSGELVALARAVWGCAP